MKIEKILLINPPFYRFMGEMQSAVPLGLSYLAGVMKKNGFDVKIYNADFEHCKHVPECNKAILNEASAFDIYRNAVTDSNHHIYIEAVSVISKYKPHLIGITVQTGKFYASKMMVAMIKNSFPDIPVVIGGNHVTADPEHSLKRTEADYAVRGEGEYTFLNLVQCLNKNRNSVFILKGLSYRKGTSISHNKAADLITDLDSIPFPDRDVILYNDAMSSHDFGNIFSSRGCLFNCVFCDSRTTWTGKVRRRSAKNVVDEIIAIKGKYRTSFFSFSDDCFVTNTKDTFGLCEEMGRQGLSTLPRKEFRWWCQIHPAMITESLVARMKKAGCVVIAIGAESGSQRTLDFINKKSSIDVIKRAAKIIKDCGLELTAYFMIGFPWEEEDDINVTINLMSELNPHNAALCILTPFPSTPIYRYCLEKDLISHDEDFLNYFLYRSSFFYSGKISEEKSREIIMKAYKVVDALNKRSLKEDRDSKWIA